MKISLLYSLIILLSLNTYGQVEISQNDNGLNNKLYPVNGTVNKSWSASIYKASDIGQAGSISKIAYQIANNCSQNQHYIKIYMLNTTTDSFSSMDYENPSILGATQVYSGNVQWYGAGWKEISLNTNFTYNGVDNLMIIWTSKGSNGTLSSPSFRYHNTNEVVSKQAYEDNNFPTSGGFRSMHKSRPNIKLYISSSNTNNLGLSSWQSPLYGAAPNSAMTVSLKVKNVGTLAQSGYSVKYSVDNGQTWVTKSNLPTIANGATTTINFNTSSETANMSNPGLYHCIAVVSHVGDTMAYNDTLKQDIYICGGSMSQDYTIGKDTASDFPSIESALRAVRKCGINGHIRFRIKKGVYNKQTHISAVAGLSSTKTITFESLSGKPEDVVFQYQSFVKEDNFVLRLDTVSYINFRNLTFTTKGTGYSNVVHLFKSSYITFDGNNLYGYNGPSFNNIDNQTLFLIDYDSYNAPTSFHDIYVKNNTLRFGSQSIKIDGGYNVFIDSNDITKSSNTSVSASCDNLYISNNIISTISFYGDALCVSACNSAEIYNNRLSNKGGIVLSLLSVVGTSSNRIKVYNNFITQENQTLKNAVYTYQSSFVDFFYNSVLVKGNNSSCASFRINTGVINLRNNNIINLAGGYAIQAINSFTLGTSDYNNHYTNGSVFAKIGANSYSNLTSYITAVNKEAHSLSINAPYISDNDLHQYTTSVDSMGIAIAGYTTDIDGQVRNTTTPDIGADEFTIYATDATPLGLSNSICGNTTQDLLVDFKNVGTNVITDMVLGWSIDGITQPATHWVGSIPVSNNETVNLGSTFITYNSQAKIKVWIDSINNNLSINPSNDTLVVDGYHTSLNGVFRIGGSPVADFFDIKDAINALSDFGVCGPVVFNIEDGIYYGQYYMQAIEGVNSVNTVTFQSLNGIPENVRLINYSEQEASSYIFKFDSVSYITIKDVFLHYNDSYKSRMLWIKHKSHHITIDNCTIESRYWQFSSLQGLSAIHVVASEDISILNSRIFNGKYSVYFEGTDLTDSCKNIRIINNEIRGFSEIGINILYPGDSLIIKRNKITDESFSNSTNYSTSAIRLYKGLGHGIISSNIIRMKSKSNIVKGAYGIAVDAYNYYYSPANHLDIYNNYINVKPDSLIKAVGISLFSTPRTRINFNTIKIESGAIQTYAFWLASSNVSMKNNLFDAGDRYVLWLNSITGFQSDYNCFYSTVPNPFYYSSFRSFASYQTTSYLDANSLFHNPTYHLGSEFHISDVIIEGAGVSIPYIIDDIDGDSRSLTSPDIGADEFELLANDVALYAINTPSSNTLIQNGINAVNIALYNSGYNTIVSTDIHYQLDADPVVTTPWVGGLAPNSLIDSISLGNVNLSIGTHNLKVWTSLPNGNQDQNTSNDIMTVTFTALNLQSIQLDKLILNDTIINCSDSISVPLKIKNTGGAVLNYSENHSNLSWVHLTANTSGSIQPGDSVILNYVFNSMGLAQGVYSGTISISSNDINNPIVTVSCALVYYNQYNNAVNLGADTTLCAGNSIILDAGMGFASYNWSTGSTSQSISVDSSGVGIGSEEYIVTVVDSNNCIGYDTIQISFVSCTGLDVGTRDSILVNLFPNPIRNAFSLSFSKPTSSELNMVIYNTLGSEVRRLKIPENSMVYKTNIGNLSPGAYYYQLLQTNRVLMSGKLIVK